MNRYEPSTLRPAFGVAAVAISAVTLAMAVVLPVGLAGACEDASLATRTPAAIKVAIDPSRIDVVGKPLRTVVLEPVNVVGLRATARG
jgi:hypothetical protein